METRVTYLDIGRIITETVTLPPLGPNDVLVKTHQASVCGSERYFYRGITVRPQDEARAHSLSHTHHEEGHGPDPPYPMGRWGTRGAAHPGGWLGGEGILGAQGLRRPTGGGSLVYHLHRLLVCDVATYSRSPRGARSRSACCRGALVRRLGRAPHGRAAR